MVTIKESQERALGTGRSLDTAETEIVACALEVAQIPQQLLDPQSSTLTNSGELGGLEVGETKGGEIAVLLGKFVQAGHDDGEFGQENVETFTEKDEVGVAV